MKKYCFIFHWCAKTSILHFIMSSRFEDICVRKRSTQSNRCQLRRFAAAWSGEGGEGGEGATPGPEDKGFSFEVWTAWERGLKEEPGAFLGGCGGLESGWFPLDWRAAAAGIPPVTAVTWHLFKPDGLRASMPRTRGRARASSQQNRYDIKDYLSNGARMQRWRWICPHFSKKYFSFS